MQATAQQPPMIGVDVSKAAIDFASTCQVRRSGRVINEAGALGAWLAHWAQPGAIAMESTGAYHGPLALAAQAAGWQVFVLNPYEVKRYRQGLGVRGKTDRIDAQVILELLIERHRRLRPWTPGSAVQRELKALLGERANRVKHAAAFLANLSCPEEKRQSKAFFEVGLRRLEQRIAQLVAAEPELQRTATLLRSVPGIGPVTAASLAALLVRVPFRSSDALVAFVGLDPRPNDSGQRAGVRRLTKRGPAELRRLLYLVGSSASRCAPIRPLYQALRQRRSTTESIVILGRKLLRVAFAVYRSGERFDPSRLPGAAVMA